ncbi:hypothetical protein KM043_013330 [Ampulex compressa]|nr:hypothetical protein KM043_013330 [Ampulex compressa]
MMYTGDSLYQLLILRISGGQTEKIWEESNTIRWNEIDTLSARKTLIVPIVNSEFASASCRPLYIRPIETYEQMSVEIESMMSVPSFTTNAMMILHPGKSEKSQHVTCAHRQQIKSLKWPIKTILVKLFL